MFTLDQVVPWGRSYDEYRRMFAIREDVLSRRMVGCADGPASFNAELTRKNGRMVSCDPLYQFDREQIRERIVAVYDTVLQQTWQNRAAFVWHDIATIEQLGKVRMDAMESFLADYDTGKRAGRYIEAALPQLPFPDASFELALCSHFLFLYTDHLKESFHVQAVTEMCRIATEVRIFPLLTLASEPSAYVEPVLKTVKDLGLTACMETVPYEFQKGANQMLRIRR